MSEAPPPRSPFASESWEPRFVVEHYEEGALRSAIELWAAVDHIGGVTLDSTVFLYGYLVVRPKWFEIHK